MVIGVISLQVIQPQTQAIATEFGNLSSPFCCSAGVGSGPTLAAEAEEGVVVVGCNTVKQLEC